jgi:hypothetical protein
MTGRPVMNRETFLAVVCAAEWKRNNAPWLLRLVCSVPDYPLISIDPVYFCGYSFGNTQRDSFARLVSKR